MNIREVRGFDDVYVSDTGLLVFYNEKELKQYDHRGYRKVYIGRKSMLVHRLVATAFLINVHEYPEVNHLNGIKHDNRASNLEWCTHNQNFEHASRTNLLAKGSVNGRSKLKEKDVVFIRKNYPKLSQYQLAVIFRVSRRSIRDIISGRNWKPQTLK